MTKNQHFYHRWAAEPLPRRLLSRDWSLKSVDKEREIVLIVTPLLVVALLAGSATSYGLGYASRQPTSPGIEESQVTTQAATTKSQVPQRDKNPELDRLSSTIARWGQPDIASILAEEYPDAEWSLNGNSYSGLVWLGPGPKPTEEELRAHWVRIAPALAAKRDAEEKSAREKGNQQTRAADPKKEELVEMIDYQALFGPGVQYDKILQLFYAGAEWSLNGSSYTGLTWFGPGTKPSKAELDALWDETAKQYAMKLPLSELQARAGVSETEEYVGGELRPKGYSEETFVASPETCRQLPQVPPTGGGSPVGSVDIYKDPTGSQNFEQLYGVDLSELGCRIAQAHGYFGGKYSLGLGLNGDQTLMWYSDQVNESIVRGVLDGMGAFRTE